MTHKKSTTKTPSFRDNSRQFAAKIFIMLCVISVFGLTACGELEFGVETKVSSGRPEVTVVTTTVAQIPEGMVLVTVTPSAQATATAAATMTPTASATASPTLSPTTTPEPTATATAAAVQPAPTRQPVLPANTPTPTPYWAEILVYPTVSGIVWPGDSVTVAYDTRADTATLCLAPVFTQDWECRPVPSTGPYTLDIDPATNTNLQLQLNAYLGETQATGGATIMLYCDEDAWFFSGPPTTCPAGGPVQTAAAYQQFEHGTMLWLENGLWWDPGEMIYVLYDTQTFEPFPEYALPDSSAPTPNIDYDPPEGMFVPESGFGLLWKENSWIRQRLGWALAPEVGFSTTVQREFAEDGPYLYLLNFDDRLLTLGFWNATWAERSQP
ncbi:MAG: hypothetical protein IPM53_22880 [Anaerolineaceae bacterium]|nr:hypothetical protein [Anaerolineaceae bacterium]